MPNADDFNPELDTGDFDPVEKQEIEEALAETAAGNKKFKRLILTEQIKRRKFCKRATQSFHSRTQTLERKVFAWKYQLGGIVAACVVLIPVIGYLLAKLLFDGGA